MLIDNLLLEGKISESEYLKRKTDLFREYRRQTFKAFDIYKSNVQYGLEIETEEERNEMIAWYHSMKNFTNQINTINNYPPLPDKLKYYIGG